MSRAALLAPLLAGCALDVVFPVDAPGGDTADDTSGGEVRRAHTPVAPTAGAPMWQGLQEAFLDADGAPCEVPIAAAMADDAFCFVAADGGLRCAGNVYTTAFGAAFVDVGVPSARQVHLSPTMGHAAGNALCALAGGELACLGDFNASGQLGNGGTEPNAALRPWGDVDGLVGAATGTWDQLCAVDDEGAAWCAGYGYAMAPARVGEHDAVVVDTRGDLHGDDPTRFRASAGRSECFVTAAGLTCAPIGELPAPDDWGAPGHVVDGGVVTLEGPVCWLEDDGEAWCGLEPDAPERVFADAPVLLLAVNPYANARCAIHADGSVACHGSNRSGKLGVGGESLAVDTIVAPPGTVDTRCR